MRVTVADFKPYANHEKVCDFRFRWRNGERNLQWRNGLIKINILSCILFLCEVNTGKFRFVILRFKILLWIDFIRKFRAKIEYSGEWNRLSGTQESNAEWRSGFKIYNEFGKFSHQICQNLRRFFPVKLALKFLFVAKVFSSLTIQFKGEGGKKPVPRKPWKHVSPSSTIKRSF